MNKTQLVDAIAKETGVAKNEVKKVVDSFTEVVAAELKKDNGKVQIVGFGTFEVAERKEREGRNPRTGKTMKIKASKAPKFKAGKKLKELVNAPVKATRGRKKK